MTSPPPILVSREDAAHMLGMSLRHFQRFVQPHVRIVRVGQRRLIPVAELERWADEKAQKTSA
jgi:hypothetical protein